MAGLKYWVWLNECRGLTNRSRALLLDHFGSPEDVYYADEAEYALVEGLSKKQLELLADKSTDGADKILGDCQRLGLRILTMQDADYPARLRGIFEPPCLLYVKGTLPAFDEEVAVAMVGTRACTPYGTQSAEKIAYGLAKQGALVVSGAARGIDSAAHRGALRAGGVTVAVLGNGLDVVYPEENAGLYRDIAATGALLSEYPPGTAGIFPSATASSAACVLRPWWSKRRSSVRARSSPPIRRSSRDATCSRSPAPSTRARAAAATASSPTARVL